MSQISIPYNWAPRDYQMPLWTFLERGGKRAVAVWHRRGGKDLFSINWCAASMMERPGVYWHIFPTYNQGRKIAWDGMTKAGRPFLDHFPAELVSSKNNTEMKLTLKTGGIYQVVGTDDPDRLVGANPVGCIFSEYSLQDPRGWEMIRPILAENEGWAVFIYTARGKNHGYKLKEMAKKSERWFCEILTVDDTKAITKEAVEQEREDGMPEELVQQEFYCSFDAPIVGAYYAKQMADSLKDGRITAVPWEPRLPVHTAWDLGVGDSTTIWFFQQLATEIRIIDYYEQTGEGLPHFAKVLKERPYAYGTHHAPWDITIREFGTGKSRIETAKELGIKFVANKQSSVEDGIEMVRSVIPMCYFDEVKCERGIAALREYTKEYDEKNKIYKSNPLHNWASHGADGFRTLAMGRRLTPHRKEVPQDKAENNYDVFNT